MAAGPEVGQAHVSLHLTMQKYEQDLARARAATDRAAKGMANGFKTVEVANNRMATTFRRNSVGIQALSRQFLVLRAAMAGVAGVLGIRAVAQAADAWANLTARLNQVVTGTGRVAVVQEQLFQVAQRSRTELESVGNLYFKLSNASAELGMSQQQVMQFTESLSKMLVTSGVSAVNSAQAIHQLTQAFIYQRLQGDELRTMHEAFPALIRQVAEAQGMTAQQLITVAKKQGVAIQDLIEAVLRAREQIDSEFAKLPTTIEGAMTRVANAWTKAVGTVSGSSGAFKGTTDALTDLANTVNSQDFHNGLSILITLITKLATAGAEGVAQITGFAGQLEEFGTRIENAARKLGMTQAFVDSVKAAGAEVGDLGENTGRELNTIIGWWQRLTGNVEQSTEAAQTWQEVWNNLRERELDPDFIAKMGAEGGVSMAQLGDAIDHDNRMLDIMLGRLGKVGETPSDLPPGMDPQAMDAAADAAKKHADTIKDLDEAIAQMQRRRAAEGEGEEAVAALERLEAAASAAGVAVEDLAQQPADIQSRVQTHQDEAAALDELIAKQAALRQAEEERAAAAKEQIDAIVEANRRALEEQEQAAASEQQRIDQGSALPDRIDAANIAASGLASTLTDLENLSLESLAQSFADIGQQIAQAVVQALIFRAIMGATGTPASTPLPGMGAGAGGGTTPTIGTGAGWTVGAHGLVFGRGGHLKRMARGGFITKRPMMMPMATGGALIGEAGPEAVMPLKRMASGNLGVASEGGGGGAQQVNNIYANNIEPGTVSTLYNLATRTAPSAVVNARSRGLVRERKKPPF